MKLAILPELQKARNLHINRGLSLINVLLFILICATVLIAVAANRSLHVAHNTVLAGADGTLIGNAALMVPGWVIVPIHLEHDCKLLLPNGAEAQAVLVRSQEINEVAVSLLRADKIPADLLLNGAALGDDERVSIVDAGAEWNGRLNKRQDGTYVIIGDRQLSPGLPVTAESDHTAMVGVTAATQAGSVIITIEQLQQAFPELK